MVPGACWKILWFLPSLKLTVSTCKWSLGRRLFPFGARPRGRTVSFWEAKQQQNHVEIRDARNSNEFSQLVDG